MTPNQAEELHDIIRESGLPDEEMRRLHTIVEVDVDAAARRGHAYVKITSNGIPHETKICAVDQAGRTVPLEVAYIKFEIDCQRGNLVLGSPKHLEMGGPAFECELNLETNDVAIRKLAAAMPVYPLGPSIEDLDEEPTQPPALPPTPAIVIPPKVVTKVVANAVGPHVHDYVDGLCHGCLRRE